jgi:hypothetical protein
MRKFGHTDNALNTSETFPAGKVLSTEKKNKMHTFTAIYLKLYKLHYTLNLIDENKIIIFLA